MGEYPITAKKAGFTDYTEREFHKRINMKDYPFPKMDLTGKKGVPKGTRKYICMVGKCSGVLNEDDENGNK